jgi:hypothetical protein
MARVYAAEGGLLVPLDGGTPVIPPGGGGGNGGGGGGGGSGGTGILVGASVSRGRVAFDSIRAQAGPWSISRTYNSGTFKTTWSQEPAGADVAAGLASAWSAKPDMNQMASGALDNVLEGLLGSIPSGQRVFPCIWHEPDVKLRSSGFDVPLWQRATSRFLDICASVNNPAVWPQLIFTNWSLIGGVTTGLPDDFWLPAWAGKVKVVGWDLYMLHNTITTAAHELGPCRDWCDAKDLAWAIGEIGVRAAVTDHNAAATWLTNLLGYSATHGAGPHAGSAAYVAMFDFAASAPNTPVPSGDPLFVAASSTFSTANFIRSTDFNL